jgi:CheY-like chemotaxis protein
MSLIPLTVVEVHVMPGYIRLSPLLHSPAGMRALKPLASGIPGFLSFAITSMSVPDGVGACPVPSPGKHRDRYGQNRHPYEGRNHRQHAIILDENVDILEVLGRFLEEENYDVTLSTRFLDPEDVTPLNPDVIIADTLFNHGPDGGCLYEEPPTRPDGTAIPVVYSTTVPEVAARLSAMTLPILLKPFDLDALLIVLRQGAT